jgi:hypothetical protein
MTATPEKPELSPDEIAAELQASGIVLTKQDLQNMIGPRRAEASANAEARARSICSR